MFLYIDQILKIMMETHNARIKKRGKQNNGIK